MIGDRMWTCPSCEVTEHLPGPVELLEAQRELAQTGHAERHAAERARMTPTADALVTALETVAAFRVRVVVAPVDFDAVRSAIVRRGLPLEVFADGACHAGHAYVMTPRRGVRELARSTPGDGAGDDGDAAVTAP